MNRRQFACSVLAVMVSLLSFAVVLQAGRRWRPDEGGATICGDAALRIRLITIDPAERQKVPGMVAQAGSAPAVLHTAVDVNRAVDADGAIDADRAIDVDDAGSMDVAVGRDGAIEVDIDAGPAMDGKPAIAYVPAAELSERPLLLQDIDALLDLPSAGIAVPDTLSVQQGTGILLINERGGVDRVQFESTAFPRYLEVMLTQRFAEARFLPGKIDGKPVRSALRIALRLQ